MAIVSNEIAKALQQLAEAFRTTNGASPISSNDARSSIALAGFAQGMLGLLQANLSETSRTVGGNIEPTAVAAAVEHQQPAPNALGTIDGGGTPPTPGAEAAAAAETANALLNVQDIAGVEKPIVDKCKRIANNAVGIQPLAGHPPSQKKARINPPPVVPRAITHDVPQCE